MIADATILIMYLKEKTNMKSGIAKPDTMSILILMKNARISKSIGTENMLRKIQSVINVNIFQSVWKAENIWTAQQQETPGHI